MTTPRILLIVSGGIAAYKSLELVRLLKREGIAVRAVLTKAGAEFVTPLSLGALTEDHVYADMFDLKDEREIGHIQLSRQADLVVVCPASADILAKMVAGIADDLASTILLATDKPVLAVPAMNIRMWEHAATRRNVRQLTSDGITIMEPDEGDMACGEWGKGRLPEPESIAGEIKRMLGAGNGGAIPVPSQRLLPAAQGALSDRHILVTAGPTHEPIDPVRYIANRSSGRQGFAIARAAAEAGARVTLIAGPVDQPTPKGVTRIDVETALEMLSAVEAALPADAVIMVAAVADWRVEQAAGQKLKKDGSGAPAALPLTENPDILATLAISAQRPRLLVGFAAETEHVIEHAKVKLARKGCDMIIANDVSGDVMGGERNRVHLVSAKGVESWDEASKDVVAARLTARIAAELQDQS
ncbi:MAG: bifunctional phosphopantothenoylcysteine decarboxylase/phosphopantothenate--cysteine ligase CoaBC [Sphingobium sp.]|nr:bifunctional phosphopantothenoylcysteine decarboxylase/phosphopantothenate--cysteine ligase CoaBC [Sphingobium sp.]MBP6111317.1 bifunctional phosphopantothenoylcysteine decarboxylase/phosphopantothenate--cysteine ligase CoaBC [Sphingobium sp.]MBP8671174.1 bifunctional phosphopantothenoylcysteine decarboxylase/phosphopantothenate--cysteine ligase CoaBC [Sphingobium sp.]MBP9156761.1 bifunctional phosphopantothenoylcysteine decarboxylase/phosphopantothenate--cysteine ligase CoaBC [Sphingobium sp